MDDEEDGQFFFDVVDMQEIVDFWAAQYAEGVEVGRWYYDPHKEILLIGLLTYPEDKP